MEQDYELLDIIITILVAIFLIAGFIGCAAVGGEHLNDHINDKYKDKEDDNNSNSNQVCEVGCPRIRHLEKL